MELQAAIEALEFAKPHAGPIEVYADSKYVIDGITGWVHNWERNGWRTKDDKPVANADLWRQLLQTTREVGKRIRWFYIKAHAGHAGNERADTIASEFALGHEIALYHGPFADYPHTTVSGKAQGTVKKKKPARKSGTAFSYISLVDGKILTHRTWGECEARVKGRSAKFKKAMSQEEERQIIREWAPLLK